MQAFFGPANYWRAQIKKIGVAEHDWISRTALHLFGLLTSFKFLIREKPNFTDSSKFWTYSVEF